MSDLGIYIAATALDAQQVGMDTVSQDIANVNTPFYSRETTNMSAVAGVYTTDAGVSVPSVSQINNAVTTAAMMTADGMLSAQQATNQVLTSAQSLFPEPNGGGLQSLLSQFWSQWDNVANEPSNSAARQALVGMAQQVANALNQASGGLSTLQNQLVSGSSSSLQSTLTQANTLLDQVANLNQQILTAKAGASDANALIDQRRQYLDQLAQLIGTTYRDNADGTSTVYLGGLEVVQDNQALPPAPGQPLTFTLSWTGTSANIQVNYTDSSGVTVATPPLGGTAAGLVAAVNYLNNYQTSLNNVASTLASTVNNQQASGYYWAGGAGSSPSASGTTAYAGSVDTSGNPLAVFVNSRTGTSAGVTATNIGLDSEVTANPYYLAASSQSANASTMSSSPTPASTTIGGSNDTLAMSLNGVSNTLTLTSSSYTPTALATEVQNQLNAQFGPGQATATINPAGYLVITDTAGGAQSLQVTGGTALGTLGLTAMQVASTGGAQQNNGGNAQLVAELANSLNGPDPIYRSFISQLGTDVSTSTSQMKAQQSATNSADQIFQSLSGVSTDEETIQMQLYQQAYQAAAKVVTAAQAMFQSLIQAV